MKKLLTATILVLSSSLLAAQNWELFQDDSTYNFNPQNSGQSPILGLKIDSVLTQANQSTFFFNRIFNDTVYQNFYGPNVPITDITQPNIYGEKAIRRNDSIILTNQFGSRLYLVPKAKVNTSWNLIDLGINSILASVDSAFVGTINGVSDSIKHISFLCLDSNGNPKSHKVNQMKLEISKSHGILESPNFYENIEGNSINNNYKKSFTRIYKSTYYTKADQLELSVGDEYHTRKERNPQGPPDTEYSNYKVLSKNTSANGDTITLTFEVKKKFSTLNVDYSTNPPTSQWNHSYANTTETKTIVNANQLVDSFPAMHVSVATDSNGIHRASTNLHSLKMGFVGGPFNNRLVFKPQEVEVLYDSSASSWIYYPYAMYNVSYYYLKGITELEFITVPLSGAGVTYVVTYLEYFKKGSETYGTPQIVTGIEESQTVEQERWFYPNPAQDILHLAPNSEVKELRFYDLKGKLVKTFLQPQNEIKLSGFKAGTYLIRSENEDGSSFEEKLIIQR
ncbi:MAG: T9SS type A sorting domain-containing protein [Vicingaceae bacterium]